MPARLIVSDVDGCLCPEESEAWDPAPLMRIAALTRAAADGFGPIAPLTLCTGRPQPYVELLMKLLDIRLPAICENGAVVYTLADNRAVYGPGVTPEKLAGLAAVRAFIERQILPQSPDIVRQFGKEAQISLFSRDHDRLLRADEQVRDFVVRQSLPPLVIETSHYYLNISLEGVDKGRALEWLLEREGLGAEEVVGIGDTEGDLPLRRRVGFFACPANARPSIRAVADYISPAPVADGVLDILSRPECQRA
ncbi:MAG: HAD family phosphatase [Candidatus Sumerlaeia bacterium]|nr:HAD family phosphatase [Candidatus Sumerlaeia bacterium]